MLSTSHQFLFIHIPKTAGNTIQDALREYSDDKIISLAKHQDGVERFEVRSSRYNTIKHSTLKEYENEYGREMMNSLFKFTCVRNPWDRCMSHYFSPHRGRVEWHKKDFLNFVVSEVKPISHFLSRWQLLDPVSIAIKNIDFIIRHEKIEVDFDFVCKKLGIPKIDLPQRNKSLQSDYRKFYDSESIRHVQDIFFDEINYFSYSFE